jgi:hypothetical protein
VQSPNFEHCSFAKEWIEAFPDATSYACPGLQEKEPDIPFDETVGEGADTPASWPAEARLPLPLRAAMRFPCCNPWTQECAMHMLCKTLAAAIHEKACISRFSAAHGRQLRAREVQIEVTFLSHEANPFNGKPFFSELLVFHRPSKVLLTTDFFWNYPKEVPFGTKLWKFGMDRIYRPFYFNLMIKDKGAHAVHCCSLSARNNVLTPRLRGMRAAAYNQLVTCSAARLRVSEAGAIVLCPARAPRCMLSTRTC